MNLKNSNVLKALTATSIFALSVGMMSGKAAAQAAAEDYIELQDIILFGAKDTNELADTSASVGIATAKEIKEYQLQGFRDVFRVMANVMDADWNDAGFIIRGVNSEGFVPGGAPLASVYVDGVQQTVNGSRRGARGLWDVEQVEVYRGPQSTQSGRAAMAGAVYIKTKDPVFEREASFSGTVGNNNTYGAAMMFNEEIIQDQLAFRFAASFEESESDLNYPNYEDFVRFHDFSHDTYYNLRGKVLLEPSAMPETRALLSYSFSHDAPTMDDIAGPDNPDFPFPFDEDRGDLNVPLFTEARSNDVHNVGLEVTHDFSEALTLTALTGFTHSLVDRPSVNEGTPGEISVLEGQQEDLMATQEVRLNYEGDRWSWVGGLYAGYEEYDAFFNRNNVAWGRYEESRSTRETSNFAVFGEATYEFVPSWYVTAGGRVDYTTQDITELFTRNGTPLSDFGDSLEEVNLVPKLGLSKDLTEFQTVGLTYSQGFRTGGSGFDRDLLETYTWEPEKASTYEAYYKGRFFGERLTLNANVFYTEFQDQQIEVRTVPDFQYSNTKVVNAASSESYGFEIEPRFDVTEQLTVFASIGYVHTKFKEFDDSPLGDVAGYPFPEAPEWTVAIGGQYTFRNGFYVGGDLKYTSDYLSAFGFMPTPYDWIDERVIVNAQAGYRTEKWELNFFAENLLDERYFVFQDQDVAATLGDRRSYGVNAKVNF